jgi:hypothetical protein
MMTVALAGACAATAAWAQKDGQPNEKQPIVADTGRFGDASAIARKYQDFLYGVIKEKNPNELILTQTKFGVDQTFKLNKKTKFVQDGKPSSLDKLKLGDRVFIDVDTDKKTGELTAKKIVSGVDVPSLPSTP